MTLGADNWRKVMQLGLSLLYPPLFHRAEHEITQTAEESIKATERLNEAADQISQVAIELRTGENPTMADDIGASIEEIAEQF